MSEETTTTPEGTPESDTPEVTASEAATPEATASEVTASDVTTTEVVETAAAPIVEATPAEKIASFNIINRDEDDDDDEDDASQGMTLEMLGMYEDSIRNLEEGEIVEGTVLRVDEKEVLVDIGGKSEGVISIEEFAGADAIKVGDRIDVFLEKMENADGLVELSKTRADFVKVWDKVKEAYDNDQVVEGKLQRKIKGGVVVDLFGVEAFLPGSQIALRQVQNTEDLLDQVMRFKIIKLNKRRRNIVVSRRVVLEAERAQLKDKILSELAKDQVREGIVKNITDFGAFVDLGGIDGLLHITDMSWGRVNHPSEVVNIGDKLLVKVLNFDPERERISLGLKQLTPYPWENVDEKYKEGTRVRGKVVSITDYGAFVELEKGVEGLIYISEMSWTRHVRHPSKIAKIGDMVECVVLKVDKENEKISLSLKQTETDPWETLDLKYPSGTRLAGKVRNLTNFGAFVELEEGIDGLVHISDMSWTRRVNHPSEVLKKGQDVEVEVLNIDKSERRISLGLKQVQENPWPAIETRLTQGLEINGKVVRLIDRGVVVDLGDDLEGFVPLSQLGLDKEAKPADSINEGDDLALRVTQVDVHNQRIVLAAQGAEIVDSPEMMDDEPQQQQQQQQRPPARPEAYKAKYSGSGSASIGDRFAALQAESDESEAPAESEAPVESEAPAEPEAAAESKAPAESQDSVETDKQEGEEKE